MLPMLALGPDPEAVAWAMAAVAAISTITHSSLPMPGWVERWVLVGPHLHRLHPSAEVAHHDRNFAIFCPWLDRIFGTLHWQDAPPARLGAPDAEYDTRRPLADMARAFRIAAGRWRQAAPPTTTPAPAP
jgi:sterol desaturase/sphingolipid hydroxylase (fatty acid hydroxylase superfamily)